jgi:hypothetical protein
LRPRTLHTTLAGDAVNPSLVSFGLSILVILAW